MGDRDRCAKIKENFLQHIQAKADFVGLSSMDLQQSLETRDTTSGEYRDASENDVHCLGKGTCFPGQCHHCGRWSHRLSECPAKDTDMNKGQGQGALDPVESTRLENARPCQCERTWKKERHESGARPRSQVASLTCGGAVRTVGRCIRLASSSQSPMFLMYVMRSTSRSTPLTSTSNFWHPQPPSSTSLSDQ